MLECDAGVPRGQDGAIGNRLVEELHVVGFGGRIALEQQVRMGVDEAREHGQLRQIDHPRTLRLPLDLPDRPDGLDPLSFDQDGHGALGRIPAAVDQAARFHEDQRRRGARGGRGRLGRRLRRKREGQREREGQWQRRTHRMLL